MQYDKLANRWILTQFSVSTTPYLQCVAVSTTSDATGTYYRYAFSYGNTQFNDYPKMGVWPDGYYISYNIFNNAQTFAGSKVCAFDRTKMLAGDPTATQQCFQLSTSYGGLLPADLDGTTAPPAGSPNFFMNFGANSLNLWKFHVDFANSGEHHLHRPDQHPGGGVQCGLLGRRRLHPAAQHLQQARLAGRPPDVPPGLPQPRRRRVAPRQPFGGRRHQQAEPGHQRRWYEVRNPNGTPSVFQQGTLGTSDGFTAGWAASPSDKQGNIALGYSASSGSVYPSIRYTGRLVTDALGTMQTENIIQAGGGSQTGTLHRWGDYSAMTVDPVDDCTFWYTTEYLKANGSFNWSTRIASFKFPGCQSG